MRLLTQAKDHSHDSEIEVHKVLQLKPKMKHKADGGFYLNVYLWGLEAGLDGRVRYEYDLQGTHRNPKVERHIGGLVSGSDQLRSDGVVIDRNQEMFWVKDIGIWDFKVIVTDRVTGQKVVQELKGVEVTK